MEKRVDMHNEAARQLVKEKRKDRAMLVLKKKKLTEKQISQLHALILNSEEMVGTTCFPMCIYHSAN
jgi:charged multivesicular body protein 6